ncbi:MAG: DUF2605 domain-containing protein [Elainellaceae cyanobacterium]
MLSPDSPERDLLEDLLKPLLEDFQNWFARVQLLLETELMPFFNTEQQADFLALVEQAYQEVRAAQMLMEATDYRVGVELSLLWAWHQLATECWQLAVRFRLEKISP